MNKMGFSILSLAGLLIAAPAVADIKIGYVNGQKVLNEAPQATRAKKKIEKEFEKRDQELQSIAKRLQAMQDKLEKDVVLMSETEKRNKEREFNEMNREFQRKQREFREDLNLRQNEETAAIFERVNKVIKQIGDSEKYDIILQEVVYFNPHIDITEKVIKALGDGTK